MLTFQIAATIAVILTVFIILTRATVRTLYPLTGGPEWLHGVYGWAVLFDLLAIATSAIAAVWAFF